MQIFWVSLGVAGLVVLAVVLLARPGWQETAFGPTASAWRGALAGGDGNDWVRLSDRDKMALCLKAAADLGKGEQEARAYRDFLETSYRRPSPQTRGRPIVETIAVCQVSIDNGADTRRPARPSSPP